MDIKPDHGLKFTRVFVQEGIDPLDTVTWVIKDAVIISSKGEEVFRQDGVEIPDSWSENTLNIVTEKYFRVVNGVKEHSAKQMFTRVADWIHDQGIEQNYFDTPQDAENFRADLLYMLLHGMFAFNSPVWFNVGVKEKPQCSACMPYDVLVNTTDGLLPIGELVEMFRLNPQHSAYTYNRNGSPTKITAAICNGKRYVMEFGLSDGSTIRMTQDHVVFAKTGEIIVEKLAGDLVLGEDQLLLSEQPLISESSIPVLPQFLQTTDVAWLAGVMVGNGYSGRPDSSTSDIWELKINTEAERVRATSVLAQHGIPFTTTPFPWGFQIRGYGAAGRRFWQRLDLWNHTWNKQVPAWVFQSNRANVGAFLQGLFDTDGTVVQQSNGRVTVQLSNTSRQVILSAHSLLRALGIFVTRRVYEDSREDFEREDTQYLTVNDMRSVERFSSLVGFTHSGKATELSQRDPDLGRAYKEPFLTVTSKKKVGSTLVYDIQTEAGCFWADGLLVHNCFIQPIKDTMDGIMSLQASETRLFKQGSGTGTNFSTLRSSYETLSTGGLASGPISFMEGFDANAGATKSGGSTRRAAKIVLLNVDHPDILEQKNGKPGFIRCKAVQEKKARILFQSGEFSAEWNKPGNVYDEVQFQNANNSVRVTDEFMRAVGEGRDWQTKKVKTGEVVHNYKSKDLYYEIAAAAHKCGCPGLQFTDTINSWHTCPASGMINATNPCQPAWATVLTPNGIRTFADIDAGSVIWSGKQWTAVTRKVRTGVKPVYRYYTRAGIFAGTEQHHVISAGERVEVQDASIIDTCQLEDGKVFPNCPELRDLQDVVDGLMVGDGYIKSSNEGRQHYPLLCVGENDQSYFQSEIKDYLNGHAFDKLAYLTKTTITSEELPNTPNRFIPPRFFFGSATKRAGFLYGLYSASGSVVGKRVTLKSASFVLIDQVQQMLSSLGIRSYYTTNQPHEIEFSNGVYTSKESYDLNISTDRDTFRRLIGFLQPYKTDKLEEICNNTEPSPRGPKKSYEIVARSFVGEEPVYDITVDAEEHTYWTGGLLVSNCSEFAFLDDSACNLGSLNLLKFTVGQALDIPLFQHACELATTAMEILVDASSYPTEAIAENSHKFRPLGLGYANLGALLTLWGLPYDSNKGRNTAAAITAIMGGAAYLQSARIAGGVGTFEAFPKNKAPMMQVIHRHLEAARVLPAITNPQRADLVGTAYNIWIQAKNEGERYGYRNAQVTLLAPTGTISFLMGCDTTGIEPMLGCVTYKKLVGEGLARMPNSVIKPALENLGYPGVKIDSILQHLQDTGDIHSATAFDERTHGPIFAESLGSHAIAPEGHVDMMAAVQPFLSGSISKTVNMAETCTVEDVAKIYLRAWTLGVKCIAIFRDNCKLSQPVSTKKTDTQTIDKPLLWGERKKLPKDEVRTARHKFDIGGQEGYFHLGFYDDGNPCEIFVRGSKQGSTFTGLLDALGVAISVGLQFGAPIELFEEKLIDTRFDPSGFSPTFPDPTRRNRPFLSILDYLGRWLKWKQDQVKKSSVAANPVVPQGGLDGPPCRACGMLTRRSGSCYVCSSCGETTGCG